MIGKAAVRGSIVMARRSWGSILILLGLLASDVHAQTFTSLFSFGGMAPGKAPGGSLTLSGTTLYGVTSQGGMGQFGNVFSVGTDGSGYRTLLNFSGSGGNYPGEYPWGGLTLSGTTLYGATATGGAAEMGNVFSIGTNGTGYRNLVNFTQPSGPYPGFEPTGCLTLIGTTLYGMTELGTYAGEIFSVGTNGSGFTNLFTFRGGLLGDSPVAGLTLSGSTFFGTTYQGGTTGRGTVFSIGTDGSGYRTLYSFNGGRNPACTLTLSGTTLYGITPEVSEMSGGITTTTHATLFSIGTDGSNFRNLLTFTGTTGSYLGDGGCQGLTLCGTNLYGTNIVGGSYDMGNVFCVGIDGSGYRSLLSFTGTRGAYPGEAPWGSLTLSGSARVGLGSAVNATIISGGTGVLGATVTNSATTSTLYGTTSSGGLYNIGTAFSVAVADANSLNYTLAARVQSGSATLGTSASGSGSLASGASQRFTVSATSTNLGVNTLSFTASDPNSSNLTQATTAALTVLDHAAAAFVDGGTMMNVSFGTVHRGTHALQFQIENLSATYRAGLDLDSIASISDPLGVFSTDAMLFTDLAPGAESGLFDLFLNDTTQDGQITGQYQFNLSDEKDLSGHAGQQTLTLNITATVVPEPGTLALLAAGILGLGCARQGARRIRSPVLKQRV